MYDFIYIKYKNKENSIYDIGNRILYHKRLLKERIFLSTTSDINLPAMWEPWVRSLGWENPLENGKATHSGILVFWPGEFHGHSVVNSSDFHSQWGRRVGHHGATFFFRYAGDATLMAESKEELKSLLTRVKEEVRKLA